jgi:hypothetical protein
MFCKISHWTFNEKAQKKWENIGNWNFEKQKIGIEIAKTQENYNMKLVKASCKKKLVMES